MADAGSRSEATSMMDLPHFGTPDKRTAGPQYCSTPLRSSCTQEDGATGESDVSTFLTTLDEFVEACESFLVPPQSTSQHAHVAVPGSRDSAAGAEVNLQAHACSIQCDCFVEGDVVDYGEGVDETESGIVFGDDSEYIEACCSDPCGSYSQNAAYCSGQVSCSEHDYADHLSDDDCCQNLQCRQDCDTCEGVYQEPGPTSRDLEQRNFQNYSAGMGKKHAHLPLSFCQENVFSCRAHGKKEGEQYERYAGNIDQGFEYCEEPKEFDYQNQGNDENSDEGDDALYPEECAKAHHKDEWKKYHNLFNNFHQGQIDFMAHKSQENTESASGRNEWQQHDGQLSKSYEVQDSFTVDKDREKANHVSCASSPLNSNLQEPEEKQGQQFANSFNGSCEMEDAFECREYEEPKEAQCKQYQASFCSGCQWDSDHHAGRHLEGIYCRELGQYLDHYDRSFAPQEAFTSGENQVNTRNVSCTHSELTLAQNFNHQELENRSKPRVRSFQSIHFTDNKFMCKECDEDLKEGNNKHYQPRFTSRCQDSCITKSYLERRYKNDFGLNPNSHNRSFAPWKAFTSSKGNKSVRQVPCTSTTGSLKCQEIEETGTELCAPGFNSSCVMEDALTFKQHEEPVEPEQVTSSELCVSSFNSSCVMEDAFTFKQHEESVEPEQVTRSELSVSSFNSSSIMENVFTFKQHQGKLNAGGVSPRSPRNDDHVSERCLKELHEKGSNHYPRQRKLSLNSLLSSAPESNFGAHIPSSVHSVCSSDHQVCSSGPHPRVFISSCYAADKRSALCAATHDKVSSCDSNNSIGRSMSEGCCSLSPSEKKGGESERFAATCKDDAMQRKICITVPYPTSNEGKTKERSLQPWLGEASVGSPAYFTGIVQAIPDDCVRSPTRRKDMQTVPVSCNTDGEPGSILSSLVSDSADPLYGEEPGDSNDVLKCSSVNDGNTGAFDGSEEKLESEIATVEDKAFKGAGENNAANAGAYITKSDPTPASDTCDVPDIICDGADSHDTTLVVADDGNTASSMPKHDLLSPSRSVISEDVLDISVWIDEDDTFVAEVESPVTSTKKTKEHQKPHVQTEGSISVSPVPVCTVSPKDLRTQGSPDVLVQPRSSGITVLAPPISEEAPSKVEASSCKNEDMRMKIDNIRRQREQQSEHRLPHSHEDLHAQASGSKMVGDRVIGRQGPGSEAPGTKRHAPFMSENPEENMDNENPEWEAVRRLTTEEERYQAVKKVWQNSSVPDPHQELSTFHYRRHLLGMKLSNTPARKRGKRKALHDSSSLYAKPAKRQRFDTDIIDLKLKELERKKDKDVSKAHDMFRYDMDMLHRDFRRNEAQSSRYRGQTQHRRAHTAPWDFRYYQMQERRIHEEFMASAQSINNAYSARANKLLSARDEVRRFDAFYAGLQDSDPRLLSDRQIKENLKLEELLGRFNVAYGAAKE